MKKRNKLTKSDYKHLNNKYGLFSNNVDYNFSEKSVRTNKYSFLLWSCSYLIDKVAPNLHFDDVAFLFMISDLPMFEEHILHKRTGWGEIKNRESLERAIKRGYIHKEIPKSEYDFYKQYTYKVPYKYHQTPKLSSIIKRFQNEYDSLLKNLPEDVDPPRISSLF